jgi:Flp pilus assembly protein TadD
VQRQYGIALLRAGRLDEAASILDGATLLDRHDPDAWSALGEAQLRLHYYTRAVSSLRTAVTLDSMRAGTWRALAGALSAVRHPMPHPRAELAYRQAIRLDPDDADARYEYARLLDVSRRDVEAMEQLDRALELDPMRTDFHLTACMMHKRKVRLAEALRHCERARGLEPGDAEVWAELATTRYVAGDLVGADSAFATAVRLRPGFYDRRPELRDLWSATREERDRPLARSGADVP